MSSGLRVSTGCRPQVFFAKHYCTGRARRTDGQYGLAVQFQQHRAGVRGGDLEGGFGGGKAGFGPPPFSGGGERGRGREVESGGGGRGGGESKTRRTLPRTGRP